MGSAPSRARMPLMPADPSPSRQAIDYLQATHPAMDSALPRRCGYGIMTLLLPLKSVRLSTGWIPNLHSPACESQPDKRMVNIQLIYGPMWWLCVDNFLFVSMHRA